MKKTETKYPLPDTAPLLRRACLREGCIKHICIYADEGGLTDHGATVASSCNGDASRLSYAFSRTIFRTRVTTPSRFSSVPVAGPANNTEQTSALVTYHRGRGMPTQWTDKGVSNRRLTLPTSCVHDTVLKECQRHTHFASHNVEARRRTRSSQIPHGGALQQNQLEKQQQLNTWILSAGNIIE